MRAAVLRPGDWVRYDGGDHQVIALAGTSVRLRSEHGAESVVLLAYLMASPEFAVIDGARASSVEPFGLLEGLPVKVLEEAREWVLLHGVAMPPSCAGFGFLSSSAGSSALWRLICAAMAMGSRFVAPGSGWRTVLTTSLRWPMCSTSNASPPWALDRGDGRATAVAQASSLGVRALSLR